MTQFRKSFNNENIDTDDAGLIPNGWQRARVDDVKQRDNNGGTGWFLEIRYKLVGGAFDGRCVWERYNLEHSNQRTVEIAERDFAIATKAMGIFGEITDTDQLDNKILDIKIGVEKGKNGYEDRNRIKSARRAQGPAQAALPDQAAPASDGYSDSYTPANSKGFEPAFDDDNIPF